MMPALLRRDTQSVVSFSVIPKCMTVNDLEWLNGHFTLNVHYYELALRVLLAGFESIFLLIYCRSVYISLTSGDVGSGAADRDPQKIWNPQKNCGSFVIHRRNFNK